MDDLTQGGATLPSMTPSLPSDTTSPIASHSTIAQSVFNPAQNTLKQALNPSVWAMNNAIGSVASDAARNGLSVQDHINGVANDQQYSDTNKQALWSHYGLDPAKFDQNAFNKTASGQMYVKPEYQSNPDLKTTSPVVTPTGGGNLPPTPDQTPLPQSPETPTPTTESTPTPPTPGIDQVSAAEPDQKMTDFVTQAYKVGLSDDEVKQAVDGAIKSGQLTNPNTPSPTTPQEQPTSLTNNPITKGISDTLSGLFGGASKAFEGLSGTIENAAFDALHAISGGKITRAPEGEQGNLGVETSKQESYGTNLLKTTAGLSQVASTEAMPLATTAFNVASETPVLGALPKGISAVIDAAAEAGLKLVPGNENLTPEQRSDLKSTIINTLMTKSAISGKLGDIETALKSPIETTKNISSSTKEGLQSAGNTTAKALLSSQWKMDRATKRGVNNATGMTPEKFALENGIVGKDIGATSDNAASFKIDQIQKKLDAVKSFGDTETPSVAKVMAKQIQSNLESALARGVGAKDISKLTPDQSKILTDNHPEQMQVIDAMKNIQNSNTVPYSSLEALKSLSDYYNPMGIKWGLDGKPESNALNDVAVTQRSALQSMIEKKGTENGVDIGQINNNIQAAHAIESGADKAEGRMANHNLIGLGDTQIAALAGIISGGPGAVGSLLLKKGIMENQGVRSALANKLYTKDVQSNDVNPMTNTPPITRVGRIMGNMSTDTSGLKTGKK